MHCVKIADYPNRETRVTLYKVARPKGAISPFKDEEPAKNAKRPHEVCPQSLKREGSPLDITSEFRDPFPEPISKDKPGFGGEPRKTKFGNNARRRLLRAGASLGTLEGGNERCLFLTGTLPGSTQEACETIARYSSYIVDRLKTWLYDNGSSSYSMYVWERQKRGALHLHYVAYIPPSEKGNRIYHGFKQFWYRLLCTVSQKSGVDLFARKKGGTWRNSPKVIQAKSIWCQRSVAAYLSKYLGKRVNQESHSDRASLTYPVRWFGVSRPLSALLKSQTFEKTYFTMSRREAEVYYTDLSAMLANVADKAYSYRHAYTNSQVTVGYNPYYTGMNLWELMRTMSQRLTNSLTTSKAEDSMTTRLLGMMRRYSLTPSMYCSSLGVYCGTIAAQLQELRSLNTSELIEILHGTHSLLLSRYRDRSYKPNALSADLDWLEAKLKYLLEENRRQRSAQATKNGIHG